MCRGSGRCGFLGGSGELMRSFGSVQCALGGFVLGLQVGVRYLPYL